MRTDGEIDRLLREEGERWRGGVPAAGDVDAGRFTDDSMAARIPRTLIAALSTVALAGVFVAVIGTRWLPVDGPPGTATPEAPGAGQTPAETERIEQIVECGRIGQEACLESIAIVRAGYPAAVDSARAIVVDDTCPRSPPGDADVSYGLICDRVYPFDALVVLVPADASEQLSWFSVVGSDGPEEILALYSSIPDHILDLIAAVAPDPSAEPEPAVCRPDAFLQAARMVVYDYEPVDSPRQLAKMSDLVVVGRVAAGTAVASETRGFDSHLGVHVSEVVRGDPNLVIDGRIFVELQSVDVSAIDAIQGLSGCDVLLFLSQREGRLFAPGAQGFWIQSDEGLIGVYVPLDSSPSGWEGISSIDDLRSAAGYTLAEREAAKQTAIEGANLDPDHFGVPYIDTDHVVVIQYVDEAARAALEERLNFVLVVRWERVTYSQSELMRIAHEISDLRLEGVFGVSSGTQANRVIVKVGPGGSVEEISELLAARYGDAVRVEYSTDIPTVG